MAEGDDWHAASAGLNRAFLSEYFAKLIKVAMVTQGTKVWLGNVDTIFNTVPKNSTDCLTLSQATEKKWPAQMVRVEVELQRRAIDRRE